MQRQASTRCTITYLPPDVAVFGLGLPQRAVDEHLAAGVERVRARPAAGIPAQPRIHRGPGGDGLPHLVAITARPPRTALRS